MDQISERLRAQYQKFLPEPFFSDSRDTSRWPKTVGPDLAIFEGYRWKTASSVSRENAPTYYAVKIEYGTDCLSYPKYQKKAEGDYQYTTEDELLVWRRSIAEQLGIAEADLHFGPHYEEQRKYITEEVMGLVPADVPVLDPTSLALYTTNQSHQIPPDLTTFKARP